MIEENARVVAVAPGYAWVETGRRSACASCAASTHCGTSAVAKLFATRTNRFEVSDGIGVEVDDRVVIGIAEGTLTRASLLAYLLPLVVLTLAAYCAQTAGAEEGLSALAGILGLCLGIWTTGRLTGGTAGREGYRPVVLRRIELPRDAAPRAALGIPDPRPRSRADYAAHRCSLNTRGIRR
ncbi:MAG: SoxR reducing system RseC family protein [Chromatiaceae bacterium]|nr:SoxR reducing system RseC family protein [Chromatiaceae bacterium]